MQTALTTGTKVEVRAYDFDGSETFEPATICRWTKVSGPKMHGWHIIRFADGGMICCHETRLRLPSLSH